LYKVHNTKQFDQDIIITEGEWDALAFYAAFRAMRKESPTILALPGATSWKEEWNLKFKGKYVTLYYDNDKGGQDGIALIHKRGKGLRYSIANWESPLLAKLKLKSKTTPKDVRDVWTLAKTKTDVLAALLDMAASSSDDQVDDVVLEEGDEVRRSFSTDVDAITPVTSYSSFQKRVKESLYTNRSIIQTIDVMLATCLSVRMPGEPLWLFVVGPASCGKSTVIEAFGGQNQYFDYSSKLTATSLVSGWRNPDGSDASSLHKLNEKTFFIKDMTVLLGMPDGVQQQLWDLLRDAYDGYIKVQYGNGKVFEATDFKFNIIAGVTPIIHKHNDASKGERFLKIDFLGSNFDEDEHMNQAWENMDNKKENKTKLTNTILGYYKHLHESFDTTKTAIIPETIKRKVQSLAKLVARLQTKVEKDRNEGMIYRPVSAIATRLSLQFKNLITCLAFVRNETTVSESTYDIVRKVGFDSCPGLNFEVIDYIRKHKISTRKSLVSNLKIPSTRVHQILTDLEQLGMITQDKEPNSVGGRGRDSYTYSLSEELLDCLEHTHDKTNNKVGKRSTTKPRSNNKRTPSKA
jgi:predicted transcriptional regulator